MTSRRAFMAAGMGALAVACARMPSAAQVLTASEVHVAGYPTVEAIRWIGETLSTATAGRWNVRMYDSGQLGAESDAVNLTRAGALDMTRLSLGVLNGAFPATRVLSLPYAFDSVGHMRRVVDSALGAEILRSFASRDLVGLAFYDSGERCVYNRKQAVYSPADLAGLKIRVPPSDIFIETLRAFGANPTPLSYGQIFSSLQTHLIDGAENNWPSYTSSRHFEAAKFWANTRHSLSPDVLLMSRRNFDAMAPGDSALLVDVARRSVQVARGLWDTYESDARKAALAGGVEVTEVDRKAFERAVQPMVARYRRDAQIERQYRAIRALA